MVVRTALRPPSQAVASHHNTHASSGRSGWWLTSTAVVASHVRAAAMFTGIAWRTRKGCTNVNGETVKAARMIVAVMFTAALVPSNHMYIAAMFHAAGNPMK